MKNKSRSPWSWVPTLYYAEGIPYIVVMTVSVIMYKRMGISNTDIALYTSWLYLPWVIKPLWSPVVDILKTKRFWIVAMQLLIGAGLAGVALTIPVPRFFQMTLAFFWLLAFSSATHDIAADGFYMLGLNQHDQAWFVGVRSTFYRLAMITGQGLLIILAGFIESSTGLDNVDLKVSTAPDIEHIQFVHPDSLSFATNDQEALKILSYPEDIQISTKLRPKEEVKSISEFAYNWNIEHGFSIPDDKREAQSQPASEKSWWKRTVVQNLENFLRNNFGEEKVVMQGDETGNVGVVYFQLSGKPEPGENIVINFGRSKGDKSISLVNAPPIGSRITFDETNWNVPAMAVIQLDPKLRTPSSASFLAQSGNITLAWSITFFFLAALFFVFFIYHRFLLPRIEDEVESLTDKSKHFFREFIDTFVLFFKKDRIGTILGFLLLYRLGESQIVKLATPFLLDSQEQGGLALTTGEVGFVYGTVGLVFLTIGGLLGGFVAAKNGLKYWLWPMAIAINLPDVVYIYLSYALPESFFLVNACVAVEQFGYGFGFTAFMLYMIYVSDGKHKTAHFAITTAFMALGMMIPGMMSGWLQEIIGYQHFFIWVLIATIPGFIILAFVKIDKDFGKKVEEG